MMLSRQFYEGGVGAILIGCSDNDMVLLFSSRLNFLVDINLGQSFKRPDASSKIAEALLPNLPLSSMVDVLTLARPTYPSNTCGNKLFLETKTRAPISDRFRTPYK
jgi:hypothetical protein